MSARLRSRMRRERRHGARPEQADARSQDAEVGAQAVALRPVCHERSSLAFQSPANEKWHRRNYQHESGDAAKQAFPEIGRESGRERGLQYERSTVGGVEVK